MAVHKNSKSEHAKNIHRDRQLESLEKQLGKVLDVLEKGGIRMDRGDGVKRESGPRYSSHESKTVPPDFEGSSNSVDYFEWVKLMDRFIEVRSYDDKRGFKEAVMKLKKGASLWYESLKIKRQLEGKRKVRTWSKLKKCMQRRFVTQHHKQLKHVGPIISPARLENESARKSFEGKAKVEKESKERRQSKCFKCHGFGHIQAECLNLKTLTVKETDSLEVEAEYEAKCVYDEDPNKEVVIEVIGDSLLKVFAEQDVFQQCIYDDDGQELIEADLSDYLLIRNIHQSPEVPINEVQQESAFQSCVYDDVDQEEVIEDDVDDSLMIKEVAHSTEVQADVTQQEASAYMVENSGIAMVTHPLPHQVHKPKQKMVRVTNPVVPPSIRLIIMMLVLVMFSSLYDCHSLLNRSLIVNHFGSCDNYSNTCSLCVGKWQVILDSLVPDGVLKTEMISLFGSADVLKYDKAIVWAEVSSFSKLLKADFVNIVVELLGSYAFFKTGFLKNQQQSNLGFRAEPAYLVRKGVEKDACMSDHNGGRKYAEISYLKSPFRAGLKTNQQQLRIGLKADWKIKCKMRMKVYVLSQIDFRGDEQQVKNEYGADGKIICKMKRNQFVMPLEVCFDFPSQVLVALDNHGLFTTLGVKLKDKLIVMSAERSLGFPILVKFILEQHELYGKWEKCNLVIHKLMLNGGAELKDLIPMNPSKVKSNTFLLNFRSQVDLKNLHGVSSTMDFKLNANLSVMCFEWYLGYSTLVFISLEKKGLYDRLEKCNLIVNEVMLIKNDEAKNLIVDGASKIDQFVFMLILESMIRLKNSQPILPIWANHLLKFLYIKQPHIEAPDLIAKWAAIEVATTLMPLKGESFAAYHKDLRTSPKIEGENDTKWTPSYPKQNEDHEFILYANQSLVFYPSLWYSERLLSDSSSPLKFATLRRGQISLNGESAWRRVSLDCTYASLTQSGSACILLGLNDSHSAREVVSSSKEHIGFSLACFNKISLEYSGWSIIILRLHQLGGSLVLATLDQTYKLDQVGNNSA